MGLAGLGCRAPARAQRIPDGAIKHVDVHMHAWLSQVQVFQAFAELTTDKGIYLPVPAGPGLTGPKTTHGDCSCDDMRSRPDARV